MFVGDMLKLKACGKLGDEWLNVVLGNRAGLLATVEVTPSPNVTYRVAWRLWTQCRSVAMHRSVSQDTEVGEEAAARVVAKSMAHTYFSRGKASTVEGIPVAVQHFHRCVELQLTMKHYIKA